MGQQQLLLIVLGVIIVGIAIVVGINLFNAQAEESTKDAMVAAATNIGAMAQQYYKKPEAMAGGGGDFDGFVIPTNLATDANGTYETDGGTDVLVITGTPTDPVYVANGWSVTCTVDPTAATPISTTVE